MTVNKGTKRARIKKGDMVVVIAGKDYNKFVKKGDKAERVPHRGRVLEVSPTRGKVKVEGAGMIKKHQKANPASNRGGGIIDKEAWIDISNVQLIDPQSGKPTRVRYETEGDGTKRRVAAASGQTIEK
ncbi:MAG TPA: 50S ribosomal protein L24 [Pyrinomonadaceae bacterium]|jgi:large subunit ribosomal protein L24|nr:50S ribosomal protein L24 [Pyrinomonadaceae bacterium]